MASAGESTIPGSGPVGLIESTISDNKASIGGGIYNNSGTVDITRSTVSGNTATRGGGINSWGNNLTIENSTISGNTATDSGGGIRIFGSADIYHSTIAENTAAGKGSGLYIGIGKATLGHTIVTGSTNSIYGAITSAGYNLFEQDTVNGAGATDLLDATADLLPLANNGGPTLTHALGRNSDAWNAGDPLFGITPATDQRGEVPHPGRPDRYRRRGDHPAPRPNPNHQRPPQPHQPRVSRILISSIPSCRTAPKEAEAADSSRDSEDSARAD